MVIAKRVSAFVLAPLATFPEELVLLALMDGNERAKSAGGRGYGAGGRKLVELARHLRHNRRVGRVVACVLSQDNVSKRSQPFFRELHEALIEFGAAVTGGALERVRIELTGRLSRLRAMGGHAGACADDFEAIERATAHELDATLRLTLAVDYGSDIGIRENADIILRTGMQDAGVVRTSGIATAPSQFCHGTNTLWPELTMHEVDRMLERALQRRVATFMLGQDARSLGSLIEELAGAAALPTTDVTIQTRSSPEEICALLEQLFAPGTSVRRRVAALYLGPERQQSRRFGVRRRDRHLLRVVHHDRYVEAPAPTGFDVIIAPGQERSGLTLPTHPRLGYANVWPCANSATSMISIIARAARDFISNEPLLGAERRRVHPDRATDDAAPEEAWLDPPERAFIAKLMQWATSNGLWSDDVGCPGGTSYLRTAYHLFPDPQRAELVGKYMILVAMGDVSFDTLRDDESPERRIHRIAASTTYLRDAIRSGRVPREAPGLEGAAMLEAIARQWVEMHTHFRDRAADALLRRWCNALSDHYSSSVREYELEVTDNPFVRMLSAQGDDSTQAARAILGRYVPVAPPPVADRLRKLVRLCSDDPGCATDALRELRVLLYLLDVNTIGAGLAFRTAALTIPRDEVPLEGVFALDATLPLLDFRVRLANDLSGFVASFGEDRDAGKTSACMLLVPAGVTGVARAEALMRAVETIKHVCRWLDMALDEKIDALVAAWPEMGESVRRGRRIGVQAYEVGHYTTLSTEQMSAVIAASESSVRSHPRAALGG